MIKSKEFPSTNYDKSGTSKFYNRERINPTDNRLTIPKLKLGDIDDVKLSEDKFATEFKRSNHSQLHRGLENYIRAEVGQDNIPAYFFDAHNHALFAWLEAFKEGKIKIGSTLIHIDAHGDEGISNSPQDFDHKNMDNVANAIPNIKIYEFIAPAVSNSPSNFLSKK